MDVLQILTKLEASVNARTKVPGMGKSLVDTDQLSELAKELRQAVPKDIQEAQEILQRREELLNQALADAARIRTLAEEEMGERLAQSEVAQEARQHADKIIEEAREQADKMLEDGRENAKKTVGEAERSAQKIEQDVEGFAQERTSGADQYTREVLFHLEGELSQLLGSVRKGIDALEVDRKVRT